ncbi:MAG: DEAD/DEAH box helicase [Actinomycetes bacterium]
MEDPRGDLLARLLAAPGRAARVTHVERLPAREGQTSSWPSWLPAPFIEALAASGIEAPWTHQREAAELARDGHSVVVATGTASGKSLAYLMPVLTAAMEGSAAPNGRGATTLYLAPTKALAADQLRRISSLDLPGVRAATYDGDTPAEERDWVRAHANVVLTNPDMLHHSLLPGHPRWAQFLRALNFVVVDEVHTYRGVFGSHVAAVLRRLRRVANRYGSDPVFCLASATVSEPDVTAGRLTGTVVRPVVDDGSPRGPVSFALWEPPFTELAGERGAPVRRTATAETADLLTDLVLEDARSIAFVQSRRGAEVVALLARHALQEIDSGLGRRVAAYRAGYLPEERRSVERAMQSGDLLGVAATSALELGVDVTGLDAVILAGWPGTRASLWQQAGRAGRAGQPALAVLVARDDPLDTYLVHHPQAIFGQPVEATVLDPDNPYVLGPHLAAAAAELPLTEEDLERFGPAAHAVVEDLVERGWLRRRPTGWFWTKRERASDLADLRGIGGTPVRVVEGSTGRLLGTVDPGAAHSTVHRGAVYVHQGQSFVVDTLDVDEGVALVHREEPDWTTSARDITELRIDHVLHTQDWGPGELSFGVVEVTRQVVSFLRKRIATGEVLGEESLDLPPRTLTTKAMWWTLAASHAAAAGVSEADLPGALHAAEHASIGLLPLVATCDRWDIGGVSTALHADTGLPTVFVYDGQAGGAGFAERGFADARAWLRATRDAIDDCSCTHGCPSCVQSPKCGNGNDPLDKAGAVHVLDVLLGAAASGPSRPGADPTQV